MTRPLVIEGGRGISGLSDVERAEILQLYQAGESTLEIQKTYNLKYSNVTAYLARKAGVPLRKPKGPKAKHPAQDVDQQLVEANRKLAEAQAHIQELRLRKQSQEIRFEMQDDTTIVVYGVTEHFRKLGGCARFLEFIQHCIPQVGGGE